MSIYLKEETRILAYHTLIYGLGGLVSRIVGFLMLPVYTRFLTPYEYGTLEVVTVTTEIVNIIVAMGISHAMYRFYFQYEDARDRNEVLSTAVLGCGSLSLVIMVFLSCSSPLFGEKLLGSNDFKNFFLVAFISIWFGTLAELGMLYLRILKQSVLFIVFSLAKLFLVLSLNIYFVVYARVGVIGILYSTLIGSAIMAIILTTRLLIRTGIHFTWEKCWEMLRFGLPLIPSGLGNLIVLVSDRYFIRFLVSIAETGIYSLAYRFSAIPGYLFSYPFMQIWNVRRMEIYKEKDSEQVMGMVFTYFCLAMVAFGLAIAVLSKDIIMIMADSRYWDAWKVVPILIAAQVIFSFFQHFNVGILIAKKTKYFSYIDVANGILNLVLNYFLIKSYGVMGAAVATLISYVVRVILVYVITIRFYHIHFEFVRVLKIFVSASLIYLASTYIQDSVLWESFVLKFLLLLVFPILLFLSRFFNHQELRYASVALSKL